MKVFLKDIKLKFSYKEVLKGVSVEFLPGKIHALLGENGAGKSTLMKILSGFMQPDSGQIFLDDKPVYFKKPCDSLKNGIACVYQRPFLSDSLSVEENLKLNKGFFYRKKEISENLFFLENVNLKTKAVKLSGDQRFFVAFNSALMRNPKVLVLDEPTALLNENQAEELFSFLQELAAKGMNIIVITHNKKDLAFCSDMTFLSEGKVLENSLVPETETESFFPETENRKDFLTAEKCLELRKESRRTGIIPSDRTYLASNPDLTVEQLLCTGYEGNWKEHAEDLIAKSGVQIKRTEKARNLSGGMLQRLILERELFGNPEKLFLEDVYQGLDFASCERLKERLENAEQSGTEVIEL